MADLLAIHRHAVRARLLDERLTQLARAGRIGFHPDARGFEPAIAAAVLAMRAEDAIFPSARDHAAFLVRGLPISRYVAHAFGSVEDPMRGHAAPGHLASRELRIAAASGLVSNHMTHAAGYAWAAKLRGETCAVLTMFADTAADAGDFHSAVNFAGATKAPVIFFCRTDRTRSAHPPTPIDRVADKGIAYGVESLVCSADDAGAVASAMAQAHQRALAGEGPTLVEAIRESKSDPIEALEARLSSEGHWDAHRALELRRELMTEIESAVAHAQQVGAPPREAVFEDVYATLPRHLEDQRTTLLATANHEDR
ncbi:thiamine pyrophosphate-dependent dehydrogenase E1 component subunit alpha [Sandaracinus amylolyticus]|uniref:2-oxoisovalerate dehydrogenase subunit alpha n=1 Tax=Sandaracinus amylolyticus TaxID=927083 RepID=A0A0F6SDN1_9BACT|nr:thiamine pyrophosphate-dependent enzyme [Sandaracinus amylolyticus]AKF03734.1 Branched-chain alpha-keto acid dehydrogenase, E1 component, alpha subunit [Sandaracinus amylolyticus]